MLFAKKIKDKETSLFDKMVKSCDVQGMSYQSFQTLILS